MAHVSPPQDAAATRAHHRRYVPTSRQFIQATRNRSSGLATRSVARGRAVLVLPSHHDNNNTECTPCRNIPLVNTASAVPSGATDCDRANLGRSCLRGLDLPVEDPFDLHRLPRGAVSSFPARPALGPLGARRVWNQPGRAAAAESNKPADRRLARRATTAKQGSFGWLASRR